jgi:hypothetical protein
VRRRASICAALAAALLALPGSAAATNPVVGIGEQYPGIFTDPHFQDLGVRDVRLAVGWDALHVRWQREQLDNYMFEAADAGARVLLSFSRSRTHSRRKMLPSVRRFRREFLAFRARYPQVKSFVTWNEANHCSQPLCHKPKLAARYYDAIRAACTACTIVAADVLDDRNMPAWVEAFHREARGRKRIWGLHNYLDANRFRTTGTRALLDAVPGEIWFTETGGVVKRRNLSRVRFRESASHAAKATRWVFRLARLSPRIKRIYFYHWAPAPEIDWTWDSALIDHLGRPRPALRVLENWLARARAAR